MGGVLATRSRPIKNSEPWTTVALGVWTHQRMDTVLVGQRIQFEACEMLASHEKHDCSCPSNQVIIYNTLIARDCRMHGHNVSEHSVDRVLSAGAGW